MEKLEPDAGILPALFGEPLIVLDEVRKSYRGTPVLQGITITIRSGDLVSIIGRSGSGKTTLLRCINCLETLDSGSMTVSGITLSRSSASAPVGNDYRRREHDIRQEVGMVFQHFNLFPHKTVLENVTLALTVVKLMPPEQAREKALPLLDKVGLKAFADRYPSTLSGGQKQRTAIARALALSPKVMLYDEPTSALDPQLRGEVLSVMRDLDREGMTQLLVTHEMNFAKQASDHVVFMEHGTIVESAAGDEIFAAPKDERTQRFLRHASI